MRGGLFGVAVVAVFGGVLATLAALDAGCADPVHDAEVTALGPEAPGVSPGPTHRPGQPCLTCHGGEGPGGLTFVTAGTVYAYPYGVTPKQGVSGGVVHLVDANGSGFDATTNSVGNFYVTTDQWSPTFPLGGLSQDAGPPANACIPTSDSVAEYGGQISVAGPPVGGCKAPVMPMLGSTGANEAIDRGGVYASCAYCHFDPPGPKSVGHVYLAIPASGGATP